MSTFTGKWDLAFVLVLLFIVHSIFTKVGVQSDVLGKVKDKKSSLRKIYVLGR